MIWFIWLLTTYIVSVIFTVQVASTKAQRWMAITPGVNTLVLICGCYVALKSWLEGE
jgi:hypothetical protein